MTTDGKKYYEIWFAGVENDGFATIRSSDEFTCCSEYDLYDVKKILKDNISVWHCDRNRLDLSGLCEEDRNALDEYVNNLAREGGIPDTIDEKYNDIDDDSKEFGE